MVDLEWKPIESVPDGERVMLFLEKGEKGNGEIAVGIVYRDDDGTIDCYWTWGGSNSGSDIDERPSLWAELPNFPSPSAAP